jgi:hypothetical protein
MNTSPTPPAPPTAPIYSRGHRERPEAHRPLPFSLSDHHVRLRAGISRPKEVHIPNEIRAMGSPFVPYVVDQDSTGTCFSCAPKAGIELTLARAGTPLSFLISVLDLAILVHAIERATTGLPSDKLWDWGGDPADVATVIARYGVRCARYRPGTDEEARNCDASPDTVGPDHRPVGSEPGGVEISFADFVKDAETILGGAHEIYDADCINESCQTLADGVAISIAWCVLDADESAPAGTVLDGRIGVPDHDSLIVGYRTMPDNSIQFLLQNSWGTGWIDDGFAWVTSNFMRSASCRYALSVRSAQGTSSVKKAA